jgi:glycosyltransferase involved in cell wall biosynthesis
MRLLYIADGRSPTTLNWIAYFIQTGHEVHLASTYPCAAVPGVASQQVIPVALSNLYGNTTSIGNERFAALRRLVPVKARTFIRQLAAPFTLAQAAARLEEVIEVTQPDLMHAMRIPYEGMIAAEAVEKLSRKAEGRSKIPLLVSVWGNDFTLHAKSTRIMAARTQRTLRSCDALHTDCQRDQRLAIELGFDGTKPKIVLPGGGGVQLDIFHLPHHKRDEGQEPDAPVIVINPRGIRSYVRNDTVFQAISLVIQKYPELHFVCPGMQAEIQAVQWAGEFCIMEKTELLPAQSRQQMADLFRRAQISLSITMHDGTPNTLLEAMACGCFPIAGDLESIREWITPGVNGLLVNPGDPEALAKAILEAIGRPKLRRQARQRNFRLVKKQAEYEKCMRTVEKFYRRLISTSI